MQYFNNIAYCNITATSHYCAGFHYSVHTQWRVIDTNVETFKVHA